jgi:cysteinyl-tRNA synthetase
VAIEEGPLLAGDRDRVLSALDEIDQVLGVLDPEPWRRDAAADGLTDAEIDQLVEERQTARAEKNWPEADRIRDELAAAGIVLEDTPSGARWKRG